MAKLPTPDQNSTPKPRPPRTPNRFKQAELARAVRGALLGGLPVARVEVNPASGVISVIAGEPEVNKGNELDNWMDKHARAAEGR